MDKYSEYMINCDSCQDPVQWNQILSVLLNYSDMFSLIYFRYNESERVHAGVKRIKNGLSKLKISSQRVTAWPGTMVFPDPKVSKSHIYQMVLYQSKPDAFPILSTVDTLWDWDYSSYPMDPCFYKDGRCFFYATTHEGYNTLALGKNDRQLLQEFENIGIEVTYLGEINDEVIFYVDEKYILRQEKKYSEISRDFDKFEYSGEYTTYLNDDTRKTELLLGILTSWSDYFCISFDKEIMDESRYFVWNSILKALESDLVDETEEEDPGTGKTVHNFYYLESFHCWDAMTNCGFFNFLNSENLEGVIKFYKKGVVWSSIDCKSKTVHLLAGGSFLSATDIQGAGIELIPSSGHFM